MVEYGVKQMESRARRSSGLELLRVMAMLMVFAHHFVLYNGVSIWEMPFTTARLFLTVGMLDMGVVGVLVFFTITAWFLSGSSGGGSSEPAAHMDDGTRGPVL